MPICARRWTMTNVPVPAVDLQTILEPLRRSLSHLLCEEGTALAPGSNGAAEARGAHSELVAVLRGSITCEAGERPSAIRSS